MINLLPPENQRLVNQDYRRRVWTVIGLLLLAFLVVVLIVTGSLYREERFRLAEAQQGLETTKQTLAEGELDKLAAAVKNTNEQLKRLAALPAAAAAPSTIIALIIRQRGAVVLSKLTYAAPAGGPAKLSLEGRAPTRQEFLRYLEALQTLPFLAQVNSPVKNLIQEKNLTFTLELLLK